jgi:hypothetical protein
VYGYVTAATRKDKELCEANTWFLTKLAKEGRSRGVVTVFITQKQTADAIPTAIRDVCQVGLSFGVRTMDGAVAAFGEDTRVPRYCPHRSYRPAVDGRGGHAPTGPGRLPPGAHS